MNYKSRSLLVACLLCLVGLTQLVVRRGYAFTVQQPTIELDQFPTRLGDWETEPLPIAEGALQVLRATDSVGLRLTDPLGRTAQMHVAIWADPTEVAETCPHHPNVCYAGNGFMPIQTRQITLESPSGPIPVELSVMAQGQQRVVIAFTYQMGQHRFCDDLQARRVQASLWGQKRWPAVTKYLVQVPATTIDQAQPIVEELLLLTDRWVNQRSTPAAPSPVVGDDLAVWVTKSPRVVDPVTHFRLRPGHMTAFSGGRSDAST